MKYISVILLIMFTSLSYADSKKSDKNSKKNTKKTQSSLMIESNFIADKEQPSVSHFIAWQGVGSPDKLYWNVENKHDNTLELIDREVLLRSMNIYNEMKLETK